MQRGLKLLSIKKILVLLILAVPVFLFIPVHAGSLDSRAIIISDSAISANATHEFGFNYTSPSVIGSVEIEYCSNDPFIGSVCTPPSGLDLSSATFSSQAGEVGYVVDPSSNATSLLLSRTPAALLSTPSPSTYTFDNIVNPDSTGTHYVRLSTFATADGTGPRIDTGGVAFSIVDDFGVTAFVPPFLEFCVGNTIPSHNCSAASGNSINLGTFSESNPSTGSSQMAIATNSGTGYAINVLGTTMTSGNNVLPAITSPSVSQIGVSQFGVNLRNNSSPNVGQESTGVGTGVATALFGSSNQFYFSNGAALASSPISTDYNTFTVSYLANVDADQAPGYYSTTLTYVAVAVF